MPYFLFTYVPFSPPFFLLILDICFLWIAGLLLDAEIWPGNNDCGTTYIKQIQNLGNVECRYHFHFHWAKNYQITLNNWGKILIFKMYTHLKKKKTWSAKISPTFFRLHCFGWEMIPTREIFSKFCLIIPVLCKELILCPPEWTLYDEGDAPNSLSELAKSTCFWYFYILHPFDKLCQVQKMAIASNLTFKILKLREAKWLNKISNCTYSQAFGILARALLFSWHCTGNMGIYLHD